MSASAYVRVCRCFIWQFNFFVFPLVCVDICTLIWLRYILITAFDNKCVVPCVFWLTNKINGKAVNVHTYCPHVVVCCDLRLQFKTVHRIYIQIAHATSQIHISNCKCGFMVFLGFSLSLYHLSLDLTPVYVICTTKSISTPNICIEIWIICDILLFNPTQLSTNIHNSNYKKYWKTHFKIPIRKRSSGKSCAFESVFVRTLSVIVSVYNVII